MHPVDWEGSRERAETGGGGKGVPVTVLGQPFPKQGFPGFLFVFWPVSNRAVHPPFLLQGWVRDPLPPPPTRASGGFRTEHVRSLNAKPSKKKDHTQPQKNTYRERGRETQQTHSRSHTSPALPHYATKEHGSSTQMAHTGVHRMERGAGGLLVDGRPDALRALPPQRLPEREHHIVLGKTTMLESSHMTLC